MFYAFNIFDNKEYSKKIVALQRYKIEETFYNSFEKNDKKLYNNKINNSSIIIQ
jgi:hypothetical protein